MLNVYFKSMSGLGTTSMRFYFAKSLPNEAVFTNKYCCGVNECTDLSCDYFIILQWHPRPFP